METAGRESPTGRGWGAGAGVYRRVRDSKETGRKRDLKLERGTGRRDGADEEREGKTS